MLLAPNNAYSCIIFTAYCDGGNDCCKGQCGQGEGDCDYHSDCLPGLICDFDGWWGDDWCKAGNVIFAFCSNCVYVMVYYIIL